MEEDVVCTQSSDIEPRGQAKRCSLFWKRFFTEIRIGTRELATRFRHKILSDNCIFFVN